MTFKNIPFGTPEEFNVVVEIPKGSPHKYEYDEELDMIKLDFVFTDGFTFRNNYGYIPGTRGGDGDHLDVSILTKDPLAVGTIVKCRTIGMVDMLDRGEEDHKILAIPIVDQDMEKIQDVTDLSEEEIKAIRVFYAGIAKQKNKVIEIREFASRARAMEELKKSQL